MTEVLSEGYGGLLASKDMINNDMQYLHFT